MQGEEPPCVPLVTGLIASATVFKKEAGQLSVKTKTCLGSRQNEIFTVENFRRNVCNSVDIVFAT